MWLTISVFFTKSKPNDMFLVDWNGGNIMLLGMLLVMLGVMVAGIWKMFGKKSK